MNFWPEFKHNDEGFGLVSAKYVLQIIRLQASQCHAGPGDACSERKCLQKFTTRSSQPAGVITGPNAQLPQKIFACAR
jgi:hypothetical protein